MPRVKWLKNINLNFRKLLVHPIESIKTKSPVHPFERMNQSTPGFLPGPDGRGSGYALADSPEPHHPESRRKSSLPLPPISPAASEPRLNWRTIDVEGGVFGE